uniref:Ig-like domain-containing protein n=1 Tax=Poecilia reticulata TaxID=8081 RepID=A0A3P9NWF9_POERE
KLIVFSITSETITAPEYEGRITLFRSTGSLELRNLQLSDSGGYLVTIQDGPYQKIGRITLDIYGESMLKRVSNVKVTQDVTDLIEFSGSVSFSCSSSGSYLSFLWMNSSSEVSASDRIQVTDGGSKMKIINVTRYDDGPYICHVSNPVSSANSDPLHLSVSYGPENVNLEPPSQKYPEGSNIRLSCSADSRPPASFNWFFNGNPLSAPGSELELLNVQKNQSGNYSCQAFNSRTSRYQTSQVSLHSEPNDFFTSDISNASVSALSTDLIEFSSSVSLSCSSSGSSLSFLWMKDKSEVSASDRVQITTNDENSYLTIVNVTRNDQGSYTCRASNPVSFIISDPVNISVSYGPENVTIEVYPFKEHYEKGSDINLTCSADSSPSAEYKWLLNGDQLTSNSPLLRLVNIQMSQSGNYSCQAFNNKTLQYQTSQPSSRVSNVKVTPEVTDLIEFSGSVSFSCSSSGSSLSFLWMNSSSEVSVSDRVQITDGGTKLIIINVTRYDDGSYICHVSNPVSNANSDPVHLSVSYGPENVNLEPPFQEYTEGSNIRLSCSADSRPNASFNWFFNGKSLSASGSQLELLNVQKNQSGNYSCQAFNSKTSRYQTSQLSAVSIKGSSDSLSSGAIAGIVIGCLACVSLIALGVYFILKKK